MQQEQVMNYKNTPSLENPDASLKGKTVIVTAGHQGGGASIAWRYAASSANVVVIAPKNQLLDKASMHDVSDKIVAAGGKAITLEVNLEDAQDIRVAVERITGCFQSIDILINNYSVFHFKSAMDTTADEFNTVMKNVYATFFLSQACIHVLKQSDNPHVINIAPPLDMAVAAEACQQHLLFSISKYGMSFCTLGMAREFAQYGIAFNSLWQERTIATKTLTTNFSDQVLRGSNRPEAYAEAAYLISLKPAKKFTGNFCIDEAILCEAGLNPAQYAVDPTATPIKDIFLAGADYVILKKNR